ncbi:hypothetical protein [Candidatus Nanohalococcus occultus]|uniref:hypothetical protein n=1 Tax=Candidatus Nanohalococcus occultus TaxID=2978047 RepID=UPI0039E17620
MHGKIDELFDRDEPFIPKQPDPEDRPHGDYFAAKSGDQAYSSVVEQLGHEPVKNRSYSMESNGHKVEIYASDHGEIEIYGWDEELKEFFNEESVPKTMLSENNSGGLDGAAGKKRYVSQ